MTSGVLLALVGLAIMAALLVHRARQSRPVTGASLPADIDNLNTLLDAADETVMLLAPDGRIIEINETGQRRFAKNRSELIGRVLFDLLLPELASSRRKGLSTVFSTGSPLAGEDWREGRCLAWRLHPVISGPQRKIERVWVFAKDVTRDRQFHAIEAVFHQFDQRLLHHQANLRELAQHLCEELLPLFPLQTVWIAQQEGSGIALLASTGRSGVAQAMLLPPEPQTAHPVWQAMQQTAPVLIRADSPEWAQLPEGGRPPGCTLVAVLPISIGGEIFGLLALHAGSASATELATLCESTGTIVSHTSLAFEAAYEQSRLRLYEQALASTGTSVFITDPGGIITWVNESLVRTAGFARHELIGRTPALFSSGEHDAEYFSDMWETLLDGRVWRSEIVNCRKDGSRYVARQTISPVQGESGRTSHFVSLLEDVTEKKRQEAALEHLASHDPLTDLPNRLLFEQNLPRFMALTRRRGTRCALLFVDLDHFKPVNDQHGHAVGDLVLREIASRFQALVRVSDSVARFGGDEFVIILPDIQVPGDAARVAEKVIAAATAPVHHGEIAITLGASVGIAIFPDDSTDSEVLLRLADEAMYLAKMAGRNTYRLAGG